MSLSDELYDWSESQGHYTDERWELDYEQMVDRILSASKYEGYEITESEEEFLQELQSMFMGEQDIHPEQIKELERIFRSGPDFNEGWHNAQAHNEACSKDD